MILQKRVKEKDFFKTYLNILNSIVNLTQKEIDILNEFMIIKSNIKGLPLKDRNKITFSSSSRQIICEKLNISIYNLNNYIKGLKKKGIFLVSDEGDYTINPYIDIDLEEFTEITYKLVLEK